MRIAIWLINKWPDIDYQALRNFAFIRAGKHGHLRVVHWFMNTWPEIIYKINIPTILRSACVRKHFKLIKWFVVNNYVTNINQLREIRNIAYVLDHDRIANWMSNVLEYINNN